MNIPLLGIFWLRHGGVVAFTVSAFSMEAAGGTKDSDYTHSDQWSEVMRRFPDLVGREYWAIERGRVIQQMTDSSFVIFASSEVVANERLIAKIIRRFHLPPTQTRAMSDRHYDPPGDDLFDD